MSQLEIFQDLPDKWTLEEKSELYRLFVSQPEQGILKITELAERHGLSLSPAEVAALIAEVDQSSCFRNVTWEEAMPIKTV